jgi:hypothetical protein
MDDRIGQLLAGRNQIVLALKFDSQRRNQEIALGRSHLLVAQKQLYQTFKSRAEKYEALPDKGIKRAIKLLKSKKYFEEKDKEFSDLE